MFTSLKIISGFILIGLYCIGFCEAQSPRARVNFLNLPSKIELVNQF